jgi:hypothetical protein
VRSRLLRALIAATVGLGAPAVEVALKCRWPPSDLLPTTEGCVWAKAYLPLTRPVYFVVFGLLTYGLLTLFARVSAARRDAPPPS